MLISKKTRTAITKKFSSLDTDSVKSLYGVGNKVCWGGAFLVVFIGFSVLFKSTTDFSNPFRVAFSPTAVSSFFFTDVTMSSFNFRRPELTSSTIPSSVSFSYFCAVKSDYFFFSFFCYVYGDRGNYKCRFTVGITPGVARWKAVVGKEISV